MAVDHASRHVSAPRERPAGASTWREELARRAATVPADGPGVFSDRWRRAGVIWVCVTLPLATLAGLLVHGESAYLVGWVLISGLYTGPAAVVTWIVCRRVSSFDRRFWRLWGVGLAFCYGFGMSVLLRAAFGIEWLTIGAQVSVALATLAFTAALVMLMRERSGSREVWVDFCESAMLVLGIAALAIPPLAVPLLTSDSEWFVLPSVITAVTLFSAFSWAIRLFDRTGGPRTVEALGMAVALTGSLSAAAQVAQGLSDFTLSSAPLYALQALCMGLLLLTPLHQTKATAAGLDRLPPHAQVRQGRGIDAALAVVLLAILFLECRWYDESAPWALTVFGVVAVTQLVLASVQYTLANRETRRLYQRLEEAADERRVLLDDMVRSMNRDRHRVAAQLHEQAISSYVSFSEYARQNRVDDGNEIGAGMGGGSMRLTADGMAQQAEEFRRLMLAVRPLEVDGEGPSRLAAPIAAYLFSLYGDAPLPDLDVQVADDLEVDWTLETILFRILQEALRNIHDHSNAQRVRVDIRLSPDLALILQVDDDGDGFDVEHSTYESGIAAMRSFASLANGSIDITSAPDKGTSVVARLGGEESLAGGAPSDGRRGYHLADGSPPPLRLIEGGSPPPTSSVPS